MFHVISALEIVSPLYCALPSVSSNRRRAQLRSAVGASLCFNDEDMAGASVELSNALELGRQANDAASQYFANSFLAFAYYYDCKFDDALRYFQDALDINIAANALWEVSVVNSCLCMVHFSRGELRAAHETGEQAVRLSEQSGDIYSRALANIHYGGCLFYEGLLDDAESTLLKGAGLSETINFNIVAMGAHTYLGHIYCEYQRFDLAEEHYLMALKAAERDRLLPSWMRFLEICLLKSQSLGDRKSEWRHLRTHIAHNRLQLLDGWMRRCFVEILLTFDQEHLTEAEEYIRAAIEADRRNGMRWNLGMDYMVYAELLQKVGDLPRLQEALASAREILKECGAEGYLQRMACA